MEKSELSAEEIRRKNIADNKRILAEIGLVNPFKDSPRLILKKSGLKRKAENELHQQKKRPLLEENVDHSNRGSVMGARRRSARLQGDSSSEGSQFMQLEDECDDEEVENRRVEKNRPNFYGAVPGVEVGASWYTRMECCRDGIHRPTVAGIHGGPDGAYSIALSGGYDDNVDYGDCFTYTGEGGRDLKGTKANPKNLRTAPQSKNQTLTRGNLALSKNVETGNPVRVIRGYKLTSPFAPEEGYRYDGLYTVEKAWYTTGTSGFMVWKFALKRCKDQAQPVWEFTEELNADTQKESSENSEGKKQVKGGESQGAEEEEQRLKQTEDTTVSEKMEEAKDSCKLEVDTEKLEKPTEEKKQDQDEDVKDTEEEKCTAMETEVLEKIEKTEESCELEPDTEKSGENEQEKGDDGKDAEEEHDTLNKTENIKVPEKMETAEECCNTCIDDEAEKTVNEEKEVETKIETDQVECGLEKKTRREEVKDEKLSIDAEEGKLTDEIKTENKDGIDSNDI